MRFGVLRSLVLRFLVLGPGFWLFGVRDSGFYRFGVSGTVMQVRGLVVRGFGSGFQVSRWLFGFGITWFRVLGSGFKVSRLRFGVWRIRVSRLGV